jgi:phosphatidylethanolamine-binding protein (PEBP) family uncharacterized protein
LIHWEWGGGVVEMGNEKEQVVYRGPAPRKAFNRGRYIVTFEKDVPLEVEPDFATELLAMNPDGHTLEQAAAYGTHIFERASETKSARVSREGVGD